MLTQPPMGSRGRPAEPDPAAPEALDERLANYQRQHAVTEADDLYYRATRDIVVAR